MVSSPSAVDTRLTSAPARSMDADMKRFSMGWKGWKGWFATNTALLRQSVARRLLLGLLLAAACAAQGNAPTAGKTVLVVGDSISAAYGLQTEAGERGRYANTPL